MKKHFKVLGIMLSFMMIISCFAGCGGSGQEEVEEVNKVTVLSGFAVNWMGDTDSYSVDDNLTINEFGQIETFKKSSGTSVCAYNADGAVARVDFTSSDGSAGFETWTYVDGLLSENEYAPNDGFRSHRATTYDVTTDESGRVVVLTENNTFTDAEDGSVSTGVTKYEFEYGENGVLNSVKYYSDGELDHTTKLSYDELGNLVSYANVGADSNNVYLSVNFTYAEVDEGTVTPVQLDGYTSFMNFTSILEHVL